MLFSPGWGHRGLLVGLPQPLCGEEDNGQQRWQQRRHLPRRPRGLGVTQAPGGAPRPSPPPPLPPLNSGGAAAPSPAEGSGAEGSGAMGPLALLGLLGAAALAGEREWGGGGARARPAPEGRAAVGAVGRPQGPAVRRGRGGSRAPLPVGWLVVVFIPIFIYFLKIFLNIFY